MKPVCLHIPHSSTLIPAEEIGRFVLSENDLHAELVRITDWYTDELFDLSEDLVERLLFGYSRLLVDPERFRDDIDEPMSHKGMGAVYSKTSHGFPLRSLISGDVRERLLGKYYDPHHLQLEEIVNRALNEHGRCLIIDCHSFPSNPLPCDLDQAPDRPDFCIGTDPFHTPDKLIALTKNRFARSGPVEINRPYAGSMVPGSAYKRDARVSSIMIEVNRRLYMDEDVGTKLSCFLDIRQVVRKALQEVCKFFLDS